MELNYKGVSVLTKRLAALRKNQLLKRYTQLKPGECETITGGMAVVLWTADFLAATGIMSQAQQDLVFNSELGQELFKFGEVVSVMFSEGMEIPIGHLCVINRSFAAVTRVAASPSEVTDKEYLDLNTGDFVDYAAAFKEPPIEVVSYNLTSLFVARVAAYNRLTKVKKPEVSDAALADSVN